MILHGDCLAILKDMDSDSVDSLITDPPAGISFMGKEWDKSDGFIPFMTSVMQECLRVLKPGAHGLVWAIPRTSHWTATALEDAGFEIRDVVTHLFGSGFPKSLDISKAIDKAAGAKREVIGKSNRHNSRAFGAGEGDSDYGTFSGGVPMVTAPSTSEAKLWQGFGTALKPASEHWILVRKPCSEKTVAANVLKHGCGGLNIDASRIGLDSNDPNHRKPSVPFTGRFFDVADGKSNGRPTENLNPQGRFPANLVLSHNDDCVEVGVKKVKAGGGGKGQATPIKQGVTEFKTNQNRSLVTHRENGTETVSDFSCTPGCAVAELDRQSGISKSPTKVTSGGKSFHGQTYDDRALEKPCFGDSGGASRFFYCAKASRREKNEGCEGLEEKESQSTGWSGDSMPLRQDGTERKMPKNQNTHPTVKPTKLMTYLITMITPPEGTVLDPFMGSGSTGVAAVKAGFNFIGIEKDESYFEISKHRLENAVLK